MSARHEAPATPPFGSPYPGLRPGTAERCGIDSVEIARIERLLRETPTEDLLKIFSKQEWQDSGEGPGRAASLAARFAAKEACLKLFPRETALGTISVSDFSVSRDNYGAPQVECAPAALDALARNRLQGIALSLTHDRTSASAVALALPLRTRSPYPGTGLPPPAVPAPGGAGEHAPGLRRQRV